MKFLSKLGLIALAAAALLHWGTPRTSYNKLDRWSLLYSLESESGLTQLLQNAERDTGIPADLIRAVIFAESGFNPKAKSRSGAVGLMQVMPATARSQGYESSYELQTNVAAGVSYLSTLLDKYNGNIPLALAAYNAGPGAVQKHNGIPPYRETQRYVARVMSLYDFFKKADG